MSKDELIKLLIKNNAKGYEVGGYVRDFIDNEINGSNRISKDRDYVITGLSISEFEKIFDGAQKIGTEAQIVENGIQQTERTPVYLVDIDDEKCEVALARNEVKIKDGYSGFAFSYDKETTIEEDLKRRDFTINAMARELETGEIIDPFNGREDIKNKQIRGIFVKEERDIENEIKYDEINKEFILKKESETYVCLLPQDPLRALRAARFSSQMDYHIEDKTRLALSYLDNEMDTIHPSRKFNETRKALISNRPDRYIEELSKMGLLEKIMPEVDVLRGLEQNVIYHPEGDVFEHTKQVMLAASILTKENFPGDIERLEKNTLAGSLHDVGKKVTQTYNEEKQTFQYIMHEIEGVPLVEERIKEWNIESWSEQLKTVTEKHMFMHNDLEKVNMNKVSTFLTGSATRKMINEDKKIDIKQRLVMKDELKNCKSVEEIKELILAKETYNKKNKMKPKLMMKFAEELKERTITTKQFEESEDPKELLIQKSLNEKELEKWAFIEKKKGLKDKMDIEDFIVLCAADGLGRLKEKEKSIDVFKEAAKILKEPKIDQKKVDIWKDKYNLEDKYVKDFETLLKNRNLFNTILQKEKEIVPKVDEGMLRELGKKEDEIALLKSENKQRLLVGSIKKERLSSKENSI